MLSLPFEILKFLLEKYKIANVQSQRWTQRSFHLILLFSRGNWGSKSFTKVSASYSVFLSHQWQNKWDLGSLAYISRTLLSHDFQSCLVIYKQAPGFSLFKTNTINDHPNEGVPFQDHILFPIHISWLREHLLSLLVSHQSRMV